MALIPAFPDPVNVPIVLRRGATFSQTFTWKLDGVGVDMTGMTVRAKLRKDFTTAPVMTFEAGFISAPDGQFFIRATPALIATIPIPTDLPVTTREFDAGEWDIEVEDSAPNILRIVEGRATVSREATE